jgi:hypothetical protein
MWNISFNVYLGFKKKSRKCIFMHFAKYDKPLGDGIDWIQCLFNEYESQWQIIGGLFIIITITIKEKGTQFKRGRFFISLFFKILFKKPQTNLKPYIQTSIKNSLMTCKHFNVRTKKKRDMVRQVFLVQRISISKKNLCTVKYFCVIA